MSDEEMLEKGIILQEQYEKLKQEEKERKKKGVSS